MWYEHQLIVVVIEFIMCMWGELFQLLIAVYYFNYSAENFTPGYEN